ncbi:MAG: cytochrome-c peroxidase [Microscillaceae bacterium]|nr:cytochrome-c peroxidase [Microscillaceae bacterium]MDW8461800.1 cytochrome c peroxidase [Cytophagales bacterium]
MKKISFLIVGFLIFVLVFWLNSCTKKSEVQPEITFVKPANFPEPVYKLERNPITKAGFELGRMLFYEPLLSRDGSISCGSCHIQGSAFTHHGHDVSHGIDDRLGNRNAPAIQNMAFYPHFMWDGGIFDLDLQPIAPIESHVEMDEQLENVLEKLRKTRKYPPLFQKAFGTPEITTSKFLKALSQFMLMMISSNSRYDKYVRKEKGGELTQEELEGLAIFRQKCGTCHSGELFTDFSFRNIGLSDFVNKDEGRALITLNPEDKYKFRVPSLRNVALTQPYMHDGRFRTLQEVLNHYSDNMQDFPNLDSTFRRGGKLGIPLNENEKTKIIAFLRTLSDETFIRDKRFSEPTP